MISSHSGETPYLPPIQPPAQDSISDIHAGPDLEQVKKPEMLEAKDHIQQLRGVLMKEIDHHADESPKINFKVGNPASITQYDYFNPKTQTVEKCLKVLGTYEIKYKDANGETQKEVRQGWIKTTAKPDQEGAAIKAGLAYGNSVTAVVDPNHSMHKKMEKYALGIAAHGVTVSTKELRNHQAVRMQVGDLGSFKFKIPEASSGKAGENILLNPNCQYVDEEGHPIPNPNLGQRIPDTSQRPGELQVRGHKEVEEKEEEVPQKASLASWEDLSRGLDEDAKLDLWNSYSTEEKNSIWNEYIGKYGQPEPVAGQSQPVLQQEEPVAHQSEPRVVEERQQEETPVRESPASPMTELDQLLAELEQKAQSSQSKEQELSKAEEQREPVEEQIPPKETIPEEEIASLANALHEIEMERKAQEDIVKEQQTETTRKSSTEILAELEEFETGELQTARSQIGSTPKLTEEQEEAKEKSDDEKLTASFVKFHSPPPSKTNPEMSEAEKLMAEAEALVTSNEPKERPIIKEQEKQPSTQEKKPPAEHPERGQLFSELRAKGASIKEELDAEDDKRQKELQERLAGEGKTLEAGIREAKVIPETIAGRAQEFRKEAAKGIGSEAEDVMGALAAGLKLRRRGIAKDKPLERPPVLEEEQPKTGTDATVEEATKQEGFIPPPPPPPPVDRGPPPPIPPFVMP